jgi:trehalose 6-phosphate synthase/phosphatase
MPKTIIISNRLPVKLTKRDGQYQFSPSEGGLATGLGSIYKQGDNLWVGWPGGEVADKPEQKNITAKLKDLSLVPVFLTQQEISEYYEGFSNEVLWPLFHYYASTYSPQKQSNWDYYKQVNQKFSEAVLNVAEEGDTIWIQDYQLLLLPALLRKGLPNATIGYFQHIPFPSYEIFRLLPWRSELLEGMLGADLVGFHTFDDARHFSNAVSRILPATSSANTINYNDRLIVADAFPMGIDDKKYSSLPKTPAVIEHITELKVNFKDNKLILSIDRLDYSKGILQRLEAFALFLKIHPEYIGKISFYMIVVPSRDKVPQYMQLHDQIDKKVGNINAIYRTIDWSPVHYYYRSFDIEMLSALYSCADVCLVTPMRDGMNLVSKEYIASRIHNDGVLILSEMAGASKELVDAIIVNPNNIGEMCRAILQALVMPVDEQRERMQQMRLNISKFNVAHWVKIFLDKLNEVKSMQRSLHTRHVNRNIKRSIISRYIKTHNRIIFLDYDGTLVGFNPNIERASPDDELYKILELLTQDAANQVVLISGRKHENLGNWFSDRGIYLVAEHGAWTKQQDKQWYKIPGLSDAWKKDIYPILETYVDRTPGSLIEEKTYSLVWHYRKAENGLGEWRANELENNLKYLVAGKGLQLLPGDKVLEIKNVEISKGKAALALLENNDYDFILAIGDDFTDEDTFKALPDAGISIKVGNSISAAKFYLNNPTEVREFLYSLAESEVLK